MPKKHPPGILGRDVRRYQRETWIESGLPFGIFFRAAAVCADGKTRVVRLAECADTFFSIPARLGYKNKTVCGFVSFASDDGLSTNPEQWVKFTATGTHKDIFKEKADAATVAADEAEEIVYGSR